MRVQFTNPRTMQARSVEKAQPKFTDLNSPLNLQESRFGMRSIQAAAGSVAFWGALTSAVGGLIGGFVWGVRAMNGAIRGKAAINKFLQTGQQTKFMGIPDWAKVLRNQIVNYGKVAEKGTEVALTTVGAGTGVSAATVYAASRELPANQTMALQATSGLVGGGAGYAVAQKVKHNASNAVKQWYLNTLKG